MIDLENIKKLLDDPKNKINALKHAKILKEIYMISAVDTPDYSMIRWIAHNNPFQISINQCTETNLAAWHI